MRTRDEYAFVGWVEVRNVKNDHRFTDEELKRLLAIAEFQYDGSRLLLTAKEIEYVCMTVRFNYAKYCHRLDLPFNQALFNHLRIVN